MIKSFYYFIKLIFLQKHLIISMARREVANQYIGSLLGFVWTFVNPIVMIFVFWVIFSLGFKVKPENDIPFVVWLTAGMAPWYIFADIVNGSAGVIITHAHLIKKTPFHSQILPIIKTVSCLITHSIFLLVLIGLIIFQNMPFSIYYLQFFYYLSGMIVMALGLAWAVSALNVFIRDDGPRTCMGSICFKRVHQGRGAACQYCVANRFLGNSHILEYSYNAARNSDDIEIKPHVLYCTGIQGLFYLLFTFLGTSISSPVFLDNSHYNIYNRGIDI